jgi:2'-5' RNA ligase
MKGRPVPQDARPGNRFEDLMRAFFAVEAPGTVRTALVAAQEEMRKFRLEVRWAKQEQMHFTLKFMAELADDRLPALEAEAARLAAGARPFEVIVSGLGYFGEPRNPRVIWAGAKDPEGGMARLARALDNAAASVGCPRERTSYVPHLTLGRPGRQRAHRPVRRLMDWLGDQRERAFGAFTAGEFLLFRSELTPRGPVYALLRKFPLGEGAPIDPQNPPGGEPPPGS